MELWDLYNENRVLVGTDHPRGGEIPLGCYHLIVNVWIQNAQGKFLISQRAADRPTHPLEWECVGGSVLKGEESLGGALREAAEEVGVQLDPRQGRLVYSITGREINGVKHRDILDVWLFRYDGPVILENATEAEVAQTRWLSVDEIRDLYESGQMVRSLGYFFTRVAH